MPSQRLHGLLQAAQRCCVHTIRGQVMIEVLAFVLWFMPHKLRIAIASRVGEPFRHNDGDTIIWVIGKRTAFLERGKFTVSRPAVGKVQEP